MMKTSFSSMIKSQVFSFLPVHTKISPKSSCYTHSAPSFDNFLKSPTRAKFSIRCMVVKSHNNNEKTANKGSPHDLIPSPKEADQGSDFLRRCLVTTGTAASVGLVVLLLMGCDKAWAFGPEGPMVEEFWENVRRYALYALTVSTGVLYTVLQPIFELLKNPISAVLILVIIGGSIFIVSQILNAMVGVSDFSYEYSY